MPVRPSRTRQKATRSREREYGQTIGVKNEPIGDIEVPAHRLWDGADAILGDGWTGGKVIHSGLSGSAADHDGSRSNFYASNYCDYLAYPLGAWPCVLVHPGRIYPYSSGTRSRGDRDKSHSRSTRVTAREVFSAAGRSGKAIRWFTVPALPGFPVIDGANTRDAQPEKIR
jgi:hypothetical protein